MDGDALADEFDVVPGWTAAAVAELGPGHALPAACRGSGGPSALRWFTDRLGVGPGDRLLDCGAGAGGPAEWAVRALGCAVLLVDPMAGACRAAGALFGSPAVVATGERLPLADGAVAGAWSLGVLCTSTDQRRHLAELARVVRPGGAVGLLVYTRRADRVPDGLPGNDFPTDTALTALLREAGLAVEDRAELTGLDPDPAWWTQRQLAVTEVVARDHGQDRRWRAADEQVREVSRLVAAGDLGGTLLLARAGAGGQPRE